MTSKLKGFGTGAPAVEWRFRGQLFGSPSALRRTITQNDLTTRPYSRISGAGRYPLFGHCPRHDVGFVKIMTFVN